MSELCQKYSERFSIEPPLIMDTMRVICKAADPKVTIIGDRFSARFCLHPLILQQNLVIKTSTLYTTCVVELH